MCEAERGRSAKWREGQVLLGSVKRREEALEAGFAAVTEADGERRGGRRSPFLWRGLRAAHCPLAEIERFSSEGYSSFSEGLEVIRCL